jgi:copper chaperone CopZ
MANNRVRWRRLLTNPATHVERQENAVTVLRVDGLVCSGKCAARTRHALNQLEGVERVRVDFDRGVATIEGRPHTPEAYELAVTSVVAGKGLRRLVSRASEIVAWLKPGRTAPEPGRGGTG